jgi:hypothetical protein
LLYADERNLMTSLDAIAATEHRADLRRAAEEWRRGLTRQPAASQAATIALRLARPDETHLVRRLAALDDAPMPDGQALLALIDGEAVAALSLRDGRVVANPFLLTEEAVSLLRLRAKQTSAATTRRRWRAILHPRIA